MATRRAFLLSTATSFFPALATAGTDHLPLSKTFIGQARFAAILIKAQQERWAALPVGARMDRIGRSLLGVPYANYTLEIDNSIESPSVNFDALDCWTYFEAVLAMSRMLERPKPRYTTTDLLSEIEWTRYRAGRCTGNYLERIHYLNEWFIENEARGNVHEISRRLPGATPLTGRQSREMTVLWKGYRYLKHNPSLRPGMAQIETMVTALPVTYIPKASVPAIEKYLQSGDIAGIVTKNDGGVCSHVGLITRDNTGRAMFMHASRNFKKIIIEDTISNYLHTYSSHLGLMVARPLPVRSEIRSPAAYQRHMALRRTR